MRFMGEVGEAAGFIVEDEAGESAGVLQSELADVEGADESLERDEILGIGVVEQLGEVTSGALVEAGEEGLVETALGVGLEDTAEDFDPSKGGRESFGFEMA